MTVTHLLYLHGFRSSPLSAKAVKMAAAVQALHPAVHWWCPQLPPSPRQAMAMLIAWHSPQETFFFQPEFVQELRDLDAGTLSRPERFYTLIAKGDELLDWREMSARYAGSQGQLLEGGDHALSDFDTHLAGVLRFLALA